MLLFRMSAEAEARRFTIIGLSVIAAFTAICLFLAYNPFVDRHTGRTFVVMEVPYVGQGITTGSPLMMHGVTVGKVTAVSSLSSGSVRLNADLQSGPTSGLTDAMGVDFRPANYFGVTAINLTAGNGGQPFGPA